MNTSYVIREKYCNILNHIDEEEGVANLGKELGNIKNTINGNFNMIL